MSDSALIHVRGPRGGVVEARVPVRVLGDAPNGLVYVVVEGERERRPIHPGRIGEETPYERAAGGRPSRHRKPVPSAEHMAAFQAGSAAYRARQAGGVG